MNSNDMDAKQTLPKKLSDGNGNSLKHVTWEGGLNIRRMLVSGLLIQLYSTVHLLLNTFYRIKVSYF